MKTLWKLFALCVVVSIVVLTKVGQTLLLLTMMTIVGLPLAMALMVVPAFTVFLGVFLVFHLIVGLLPGSRLLHGTLIAGLCVALLVPVLFLYPTHLNERIKAAMPSAVADDVALGEKKASGFVIGLRTDADRCQKMCFELLLASPDIRVVTGLFETFVEDGQVTLPSEATTWGLVHSGIGQCPYVPTQASTSLHIALTEAELEGYCVAPVQMADRVDVIVQKFTVPIGAPGQVREDWRTEAFIREGERMRLAYRKTHGNREIFKVPMLPFSTTGVEFEIGLSLAPAKEAIPLESPVPEMPDGALIEAVLPSDLALATLQGRSSLTTDERKALNMRKDELRATLHRARHDVALSALRSGDLAQIAKGVTAARSYLHPLGDRGATMADVPLLVALMIQPGDTPVPTPRVLERATPDVMMPVVDAILDHAIAVGDEPMGYQLLTRFQSVLALAKRMPTEYILSRVDRLNQLASTRTGREIVKKLFAVSGMSGPGQSPWLLAFLDGRIADKKAREGFDVAYQGLCLMGPKGVQFLDDVFQRDRDLGDLFRGPNPSTAIYSMVMMGLDDAAIRKGLRLGEFAQSSGRDREESTFQRARSRAKKALDRVKRDTSDWPRRIICGV